MYDLIVLGGGPAGYLAAERAGHAGMNVLLIEKRYLGGVCLNEGCIPSKTLLNSSKIYDHAVKGAKYGVIVEGASIDQKTVIERKNKVVKSLVAGVKAQMRANKVTVIEAMGEIIGRENKVIKVKADGEVYEGSNLLIATGSEPVIPPIPGLKEGLENGSILTNREILDLAEIPEKLVVVGGGVIGLEMAGYYGTVGSKVTVIEMLDKIAGPADREVSEILLDNYKKKGIEFKLSCKVTAFKDGEVEYSDGSQILSVQADKVLVSIGRRPVIQGFGLENLGVYTDRGRIVVDDKGKTNIPGVYASGDVNGDWMLAHAAYRESEVIINNLTGKKDVMRYDAVPSVIYTDPEVGGVGETEESCKEKGIKYIKSTVSMNYSGRYMAENDKGDGICKILVDPQTRRLIGCHMIGSYASELILAAGMLIEMQLQIEDIKEFVFPHPTVGEVIREAVFMLKI